MKKLPSVYTIILLIVSFVEGGCLMVHEILSVRLIKPYLGSSIHVWTAVLTSTLSGLAIGYWLGGKISGIHPIKRGSIVLAIASLLLLCTPLSSTLILSGVVSLPIKQAVIISCILIITPIMILLGITSPLLIQSLSIPQVSAGKTTGTVYAISTLAGIIFTLTSVFIWIPAAGVRNTYYLHGAMLLVASAALIITHYKWRAQPDEK